MSVYMTEAEQIEWLKKGWLRYQTLIVSGLCIALLSMSAFKYWHFYHDKRIQEASVSYERMILAESRHETQNTQVYAEQLIQDDTGTVYADVARLMLAAELVQQHKYELANSTLEFLIQNSSRQPMIDLAKLRLSRVLMAEHKYEQALALLKAIKKSPYYGLINVTIGDLYVAMGNNKQAIIFYNRAHTYLETSGITHVFLDMKIEQLKEEG